MSESKIGMSASNNDFVPLVPAKIGKNKTKTSTTTIIKQAQPDYEEEILAADDVPPKSNQMTPLSIARAVTLHMTGRANDEWK